MQRGDKVHYIPTHGPIENGIIKSFEGNVIYIVFNCGGDWDNYLDYTAQGAHKDNIKPGWIDTPISANPYTNIDY